MKTQIIDELMGNVKRHCVVVPVYKESLLPEEALSLQQLVNVVKSADIYIICPKGLNVSIFNNAAKHNFKVVEFVPRHFSSTAEYSRLMESAAFYKKFAKYEYMLIYQLDCWIFEDKLNYFADMGYDYYGSPWIVDNKNHIGNGGFCMRKIKKFIDFTNEHKGEFYPIEDRYFCEMYMDEFNLCTYEVGCEFGLCSMAEYNQLSELKAGRMKCPMGMHRMLDERIAQYFFDVVDNKTGNKFPKEYTDVYMVGPNKRHALKHMSDDTKDRMRAILKNI